LTRLIIFIAAFFGLIFVFVRLVQPRFVFFPARYIDGFWDSDPKSFEFTDHYFYAEDSTKLHGWFIAKSDAPATILFMHGNAGNISYRGDLLKRYLQNLDANIFIFDYRGYGRSEGTPTEKGIYRDARAAYAYLTGELQQKPERLILLGRSLGGAVAVDLAQSAKAAGLILDSTFSSGTDMTRRVFGFIPVWWFMSIRLNSAAKIQNVAMPKLFVHGERDDVVPIGLGRKLYERAPQPKRFVSIPAAGHNDIWSVGGERYYGAMQAFIDSCLESKKEAAE